MGRNFGASVLTMGLTGHIKDLWLKHVISHAPLPLLGTVLDIPIIKYMFSCVGAMSLVEKFQV